jgi:macrolide transport system ATP-binding/permease protein
MSADSSVAFRDLTFSFDSAAEPLFCGLSVHFPVGFTGIVGANGAGKTTLLKIVAGGLAPTSGAVLGRLDTVYCEQRTDVPPPAFADFLDDWDADAFELRGRLEIEHDFLERWHTLSHGERKRAQIAHALWRKPSLLAIDEPTNHIDAHARKLLVAGLERFAGVGLIVSHDRELLDALCCQCVWLEPPHARVFAGGYSQAREQRQLDRDTALRQRGKAVREHRHLEREMARRRERAAREPGDRSKRGLSPKDHDAKERIDRARIADSKAGSALRQLDGRTQQAKARLDAARVAKEYETCIWLPGSRSHRSVLCMLEPGELPLGDGRGLRFPLLSMRPEDRIAITGSNGAGKSTLVRHILTQVNVPLQHLIEMPQEVSASFATRILDEARALPPDRLGHVLNVVSRLGSRPARLLESRQPSPGEIRKLLLALGMARAPHLIVMDEPTNHLDLPSIEALENALADCPCGLLLVSHDRTFLGRLADTYWHLEPDGPRDSRVVIRAAAVPD